MDQDQMCSASVYRGGFHRSSCIRNGTVKRDGKWFCCQHDPVKIAERDAKREAAWKKGWAEEEAARRERNRRRAAGERGIELAQWIVDHQNDLINPLQLVKKAEAVLKALKGE